MKKKIDASNFHDADIELSNGVVLPPVFEEDVVGVDQINDALVVNEVVPLPALDFVMYSLNQFLVQSTQTYNLSDSEYQLSDIISNVLREMFE